MAGGNNPSAYVAEPKQTPGEFFTSPAGIMGGADAVLDFIPTRTTTTTNTSGQTQYGAGAVNDMIYQILSGQGGIADIAGAEVASGGYGSSSKQIRFADLLSQTAGEIAKATAPTTTQQTTSSKKKKSIICTVLYQSRLLDEKLYTVGQYHFNNLDPDIIAGYHIWGYWVADRIPSNKIITAIAKFIAIRRYKYVLFGEFSLTGWLSVKLGEPFCKALYGLSIRHYSPN